MNASGSSSFGLGGRPAPRGVLSQLPWLLTPRRLSPRLTAGVIKTGTLLRTMWPLFPVAAAYCFIRKTDDDKFATELLYSKSGSARPDLFNGSSGVAGHWRVQRDLDVIFRAANLAAARA